MVNVSIFFLMSTNQSLIRRPETCLFADGERYFSVFQALRVQNEQLEEAQLKANNRVSNHKQATQLLQTELQDSRAQVEERDDTIQTLRSKLRESEVRLKDLILRPRRHTFTFYSEQIGGFVSAV